MCSHYQAITDLKKLERHFQVQNAPESRQELWPGYTGLFIRRHQPPNSSDTARPERQALPGTFGLIPHWAKNPLIARQTYNARSETVAEKPSYRQAWQKAQHCIIPAEAIYEPDWRSGKATPTKIYRTDGQPLGIAGLYASWQSPEGHIIHSYTMLTINADQHPLMNQFHKPNDEKRMVVILPEHHYSDWLNATAQSSPALLQPYPAEALSSKAQGPQNLSLF